MLLHPLMDDCGNRELVQGVYPRVCGVDAMKLRPTDVICGLSPRVRGRFHRNDGDRMTFGFIPACAG